MFDFVVVGKRGRGRQKMTQRKQVGEPINQIGLKTEDANEKTNSCNGVCELSRNMWCVRSHPITETKLDVKIGPLSPMPHHFELGCDVLINFDVAAIMPRMRAWLALSVALPSIFALQKTCNVSGDRVGQNLTKDCKMCMYARNCIR